ncbi:FadR family transcriptional regulator [Leeia sp. TBRC 13508]|uniref:FadR family transcriptional regulator n=1 Tax=Leeia speluncae TaxID=2884804 RepID=A0ABS8D8Y2_9NEIS|nr:FadR/GntR family transcriptional regulator [Leeia speluncae]MCB6184650.1 FadR family transcriptional regulator [Leeia speluncae]
MTEAIKARRGNLTQIVIEEITKRIDNGMYPAGDKLPSEKDLGIEFGVSRTVIREAVASLRLGGQLISKQGVGVFVCERDTKKIDISVSNAGDDVRVALQVLELRVGVENEAVALAAERRTPQTLSEITAAFDRFNALDGKDVDAEAEADFAFHLAIAKATNNPQFPHFLEAIGKDIILDLRLKHTKSGGQSRQSHIKKIAREHGAILSAITEGDATRARQMLRKHLEENLTRYRRILNPATQADAADND